MTDSRLAEDVVAEEEFDRKLNRAKEQRTAEEIFYLCESKQPKNKLVQVIKRISYQVFSSRLLICLFFITTTSQLSSLHDGRTD